MKNRDFNQFDTTMLLTGLKICSENAKRHFIAANATAASDLFGIANSHLILCAEESIKALLFFVRLLDRSGEIIVEDIYKDHAKKHVLAREVYESWQHLIPSFKGTIASIVPELEKIKNLSEEELAKFVNKHLIENLFQRMEGISDDEKKQQRKWWKKANNKKNQGFYVDFDNGKWSSPVEVKKEDYSESLSLVERFYQPIQVISKYNEDDIEIAAKHYGRNLIELKDELGI